MNKAFIFYLNYAKLFHSIFRIQASRECKGTSVLNRSLGKYFNIMAVLQILLFLIINNTNLALPSLTNLPSPSLASDVFFELFVFVSLF